MAAFRRAVFLVQALGILISVSISSNLAIRGSRILTIDTMGGQLESFCDSINLSHSDTRTFIDGYNKVRSTVDGHTAPSALENACLAAELCLGPSKVDRAPLNTTNVEQNW